jgi:hypothetical protein
MMTTIVIGWRRRSLTLAANNLAREDEKRLTRQRWAVAMSPYWGTPSRAEPGDVRVNFYNYNYMFSISTITLRCGLYSVPMQKLDSPNHTIPHKPHSSCFLSPSKCSGTHSSIWCLWSTFRPKSKFWYCTRYFVLRLAGAVSHCVQDLRTTSIEKYSYGYAINGYI